MCRLMAITDTRGLSFTDRRHLMLYSLLRSMLADGIHDDGTGLSDGAMVWKTSEPAAKASFEWWDVFRPNVPLIGHVRNKSYGTGSASKDAHPFKFEVNVDGSTLPLVVAHNGHFAGIKERPQSIKDIGTQPDSDTYFAALRLKKILEEEQASSIERHLIEHWLSSFASNSTFSLLIFYGGELVAIRGKDRTLNLLEVGDDKSYYITSSHTVASVMQDFLRNVKPELHVGEKIIPMPEDSIVFFDASGHILQEGRSGSLHYKMQPTSTYAWSDGGGHGHGRFHLTRATGNASWNERHGANSRGGSSRVTQPLKALTTDSNEALRKVFNDTFKWIHRLFMPMRKPLLVDWIWRTLDKDSPCPDTDTALAALDQDDLDMFLSIVWEGWNELSPIEAANTELLTSAGRRLLNEWNRVVPKRGELIAFYSLFAGADVMDFWIDPLYLFDPQAFTTLLRMYES